VTAGVTVSTARVIWHAPHLQTASSGQWCIRVSCWTPVYASKPGQGPPPLTHAATPPPASSVRPLCRIQRLAAALRARGAVVLEQTWPHSEHVGHARRHAEEYRDVLAGMLARAQVRGRTPCTQLVWFWLGCGCLSAVLGLAAPYDAYAHTLLATPWRTPCARWHLSHVEGTSLRLHTACPCSPRSTPASRSAQRASSPHTRTAQDTAASAVAEAQACRLMTSQTASRWHLQLPGLLWLRLQWWSAFAASSEDVERGYCVERVGVRVS
jgi:hypothetical protein